MESSIGKIDDQFCLIKKVGFGYTSDVYEGRDIQGKVSQQKVAVKIFKKSLNLESTFQNEIGLMTDLKHERCVNVLAYNPNSTLIESNNDKTTGLLTIIMQYMEGGELYKFLSKGAFPQNIARAYFRNLVQGLEYIHNKGYAHRDIKPDNTFLDKEYRIRIGDFGFAGKWAGKANQNLMKSRCGTECYMAPEIYNYEQSLKGYDGKAADIYSLGVTLFTILTGKAPFSRADSNFKQFELLLYDNNEKFWNTYIKFFEKNVLPVQVNLSKPFQKLINGMMNRNPKSRYTIEDIKKDEWFNGNISSQKEIYQFMKSNDSNIKVNTTTTKDGKFNRSDGSEGIKVGERVYDVAQLQEDPDFDLTYIRKTKDIEKPDITDIAININAEDLLKFLIMVAQQEFDAVININDQFMEFSFTIDNDDLLLKLEFEINKLKSDPIFSVISIKLIQGNQMDMLSVIQSIREKLQIIE